MFDERSNVESKIRQLLSEAQPDIIATFGFGFDLINVRRPGLHNLERDFPNCEFVANVFPSTDFNDRYNDTQRIRSIKHDAHITCLDAMAFFTTLLPT